MKKQIPIFPLNLVIFPNSLYPLHIFEERYKRMVNRCIENNELFGIVSKIDQEISDTGCKVYINKIIKEYDNGRKDILIQGVSRFKIIRKSMHHDGYMEAVIEELKDNSFNAVNEELFRQTLVKFEDIINKTSLQLSERFWNSLKETKSIAFKLAEKSGLNLTQQQHILTLKSENERLNYLSNHFDELNKTFDKMEIVRELILNDGYIEKT